MSKYGSPSFSILLVDGYSLLAAKVKGVTHKIETLTEPGHGLGDSWEAPVLTGIQRATLTQDQAFFDDTTAGFHAAFTPSPASRIVAFGYSGNTIGQAFVGAQGSYVQDYSVMATTGQLTKASATYAVSGQLDRGVIVSQHVSKAASWNTKTDGSPIDLTTLPQTAIPITSSSVASPTVITTPVAHGLTTGDLVTISGHTGSTPSLNATYAVTVVTTTTFTVAVNVTVGGTGGSFVRASWTTGGVGYQLVSALSGITGFVGKIQGSSDDVTYTDLITFANCTAAQTAQRVTTASTIPRYLAFDGAFTGTGTISVLVGFAHT